MRIIGEIPHDFLKITVFKMNEKLSIKFEHDLLEQIIKFREGSAVNDLESAKAFVNLNLNQLVISNMEKLSVFRGEQLHHMNNQNEGTGFPEII